MRNKIHFVFLVSAFLSAFLAPHAEAVPTVPATGLEVQITESGKISVSADGVGSNNPAGATVQVEKPNSAATVRKAFLTCASFSGVIPDGAISLDGNPVTWSNAVKNSFFDNVFADVTVIVKPKVDAAPPSIVDFTETEVNTRAVDGCGLYVIFDDASQTTDNTVFIFFGGQATTGDDFTVTLAQPLSGSDRAELGLGISFGFQPGPQVSRIEVNSVNPVRLTSSAGGQDDGDGTSNGALLTVGGIGDSTANPANPFEGATSIRTDDELYDLRPFLGPSDTNLFVRTFNPTNDDNIFAAHLLVTAPAIVGEGIVLAPSTDTNPVGTPHTVTARVVNDLGQPVSGSVVDFQVISGPNVGTSNSGTTNADGQASFTYTGTGSPGTSGAGTDVIVAGFIDSTGIRRTSNEVQKTWVVNVPAPPDGGRTPLSCRGAATCSIPLPCPLSPALGISCIGEVRVLVARRFLPRRTALSSPDTAAKARRKMIVFAFGIANIPPGTTQDVPLRFTKSGRQISRSGRRSLRGVMEIRSSVGTTITSTRVGIRIRRR